MIEMLELAAVHPLLRRPVRSTRTSRVYHAVAPERSRPAGGGNFGPATVPARSLPRVSSRKLPFLTLLADRPEMAFPGRSPLFAGGAKVYSTRTTVIANAPSFKMSVFPAVIKMKASALDPVHRTVVIKPVVVPVAAIVTVSRVTEPVVDATIPSDGHAPIAWVPAVAAIIIIPIARCPQGTHKRWLYPCSWYPVVTVGRVPGPIAGCPDISWRRTRRLLVNRQRRRAKIDKDSHTHPRGRLRRRRNHGQGQHQRTYQERNHWPPAGMIPLPR